MLRHDGPEFWRQAFAEGQSPGFWKALCCSQGPLIPDLVSCSPGLPSCPRWAQPGRLPPPTCQPFSRPPVEPRGHTGSLVGLGVREAQRRDRMRGGSPPRGEGAPDGKRPARKSPEEPGSRGPSRGGTCSQTGRDVGTKQEVTQGQEGRSSQSRGGGNPIEAQTCQGARPGPERPPACVKDRGRTLGSTPREAEPLADRKQGLPAPRALCGVRPSLEGPQFTPREPRLFLSQGERPPLWSQPQHAPLPCRPSCWQSWSSCPSPCCPPPSPWGPLAEPARHLVARLWNCREVAQATAPAPGSGKGRPEPKNGGPLGAGLGSCPKPVLWE